MRNEQLQIVGAKKINTKIREDKTKKTTENSRHFFVEVGPKKVGKQFCSIFPGHNAINCATNCAKTCLQ